MRYISCSNFLPFPSLFLNLSFLSSSFHSFSYHVAIRKNMLPNTAALAIALVYTFDLFASMFVKYLVLMVKYNTKKLSTSTD